MHRSSAVVLLWFLLLSATEAKAAWSPYPDQHVVLTDL
jgi:hypothetical protein